jgi:hypothetical protein
VLFLDPNETVALGILEETDRATKQKIDGPLLGLNGAHDELPVVDSAEPVNDFETLAS